MWVPCIYPLLDLRGEEGRRGGGRRREKGEGRRRGWRKEEEGMSRGLGPRLLLSVL